MFLPTRSTVDWPSFRGLEWNFTFFSTVRTNSFVHCSWWPVKASITHFLHFFFIDYTSVLNKQCMSVKTRNYYLNLCLFSLDLSLAEKGLTRNKRGWRMRMKTFKSVC